jgi:CHAT domain-containing protein
MALAWLIAVLWLPAWETFGRDDAKKQGVEKPPWQRYLQGDDAKKAVEQEKQRTQLQEAGKFKEALQVAEGLAEMRSKAQGAEHWEAVNARWTVEACRRVLRANKEEQQNYNRTSALRRQASDLEAKGRYREAQPLLEQVLAICRKVLGEEHPDTARSYNNLASNRHALGMYREAEEGYGKALAICRKALGEEHPHTAVCYNNLADNLNTLGKYPEAEEVSRKALAICCKVLGEEHPDTAQSYTSLAASLYEQGKYREAEKGYGEALSIRRKVQGEEHSDTAASYNNMAANLHAQGKYPEAEQAARKALTIHRKLLGEEHPGTATSYSNVAHNLHAQGKYREAEDGFSKALGIFRKVLGDEHPDTATSYNNLAYNLNAQGKYKEAEEGFSKALAIRRKLLGEEHPDTAASYNNLVFNLDSQGKYLEAEQGYRKALAIFRKVLGEEHPSTATGYDNLADNLHSQGKYREAAEVYGKALGIRRKVLGEEHPDTATSYSSVALNLHAQGKHREAEDGFRKALAIRRKVLGEEHPDTAGGYNNVAYNLNAQGRYPEANQGYRTALGIFRKILGEEHPDTARSYNNVAANLNAQGKYAEAEQLWRIAAESFSKARLHFAAAGLDRATNTSEASPLPALAAVLTRNGKAEEAWQRYEESLARGTWDDLSARLLRPAEEQAKQVQLAQRIERLEKLIENTVSAKALTPDQAKRRAELLTQLRQAQDELAAFTRRLEQSFGPVAGQVYSRAKIQATLAADTALVGWLDLDGKARAADPNGEHWAVVLRSVGPPVWMRLPGSGNKDAWTEADTRLPIELRTALQSANSNWQPLAQRLRQQRLQPLVKSLQAGNGLPAVRRLIVLPSAALAGVPLEALADSYTVSYAHSGTMYAYLQKQPSPTTKGLLALADPIFETPADREKSPPLPPGGVLLTVVIPGGNAAQAGLRPNDVLLRYGDTALTGPADFKPQAESSDPARRVPVIVWRDGKTLPQPVSVRTGQLGIVMAGKPAAEALAEQRRLDRRLASRGGDDWPRLPGTRCEVASLQRLFDSAPVKVLMDADASEQQLSALAGRGELGKYRYVHLATHGEVDNRMPLRSAVILSRDKLPDDKQRAELLLAGQPIPDGRLTAEEVLRQWNLHCELVTLSACQTALGKYESGEGFVGFAQALILAGSRSVCLSLWKVDDAATALLMERFNQNLLGKREGLDKPLGKAASLAEAKKWLRELSRDEAIKRAAVLTEGVDRGKGRKTQSLLPAIPQATAGAKDDKPFAHPYYWAAFVLMGDPN